MWTLGAMLARGGGVPYSNVTGAQVLLSPGSPSAHSDFPLNFVIEDISTRG